ncbi:hypothetical protein HELRODRAFT_78255, partial [Helobdella robusta]|uniref:RRM domain-containing protein n=1 Tax=Helobdella robusta TaxID=6412 RepID=T1G399_HELRO
QVDANYNLPIRPKEVTFSNINNNVNKTFLLEMCQNFGVVQDCNIYYHPINKKHLGLATVLFSTSSAAQRCVEKLNNTSSMGYIINVILDDKGL